MLTEIVEIITEFAQAFDEIRAELFDESARAFLLKRAMDSQTLESVAELTTGWLVEFNEYRAQMVLSIATNEANFGDTISQVTFIAYGVPDSDNQMEVFSIDPERRDVISPNGTSPFWKVYMTKEQTERFTVV